MAFGNNFEVAHKWRAGNKPIHMFEFCRKRKITFSIITRKEASRVTSFPSTSSCGALLSSSPDRRDPSLGDSHRRRQLRKQISLERVQAYPSAKPGRQTTLPAEPTRFTSLTSVVVIRVPGTGTKVTTLHLRIVRREPNVGALFMFASVPGTHRISFKSHPQCGDELLRQFPSC
jgi:hypothetical protein